MKYFYLLVAAFAAAVWPAAAQITVDAVDAREEAVAFRNEIKSTPVETEFFNRAKYRAERANSAAACRAR
jgi:hypothetical protein